MRSVSVATFIMLVSLLCAPINGNAQVRDCTGGVSDLSEMITCLKDMHRPLLENCRTAPRTGWTAPVEGRRVLDFGEKTQHGAFSKGIVYETEHAISAKAPVAGIVLHAGEFRSYGKLVIVDACGVDVVIAGIDTLSVRRGETVQPSAELGRMAPNAGRGLPVLYFEVRNADRPVDPNPFMK